MATVITTTEHIADVVADAYRNGVSDEKSHLIDLLQKYCTCVISSNKVEHVCSACFIKVDMKLERKPCH